MTEITYKAIGTIRSPFKAARDMPIQAVGARGVEGTVEIESEFQDGLKDLEGFSHIILIYYFHRSKGLALEVKPFMDDRPHGIFATRAPSRPNPIGTAVVRLTGVQGCTLKIQDVDIVDETPLLDIKSFVPDFDVREAERVGWLSEKTAEVGEVTSNGRFSKE